MDYSLSFELENCCVNWQSVAGPSMAQIGPNMFKAKFPNPFNIETASFSACLGISFLFFSPFLLCAPHLSLTFQFFSSPPSRPSLKSRPISLFVSTTLPHSICQRSRSHYLKLVALHTLVFAISNPLFPSCSLSLLIQGLLHKSLSISLEIFSFSSL